MGRERKGGKGGRWGAEDEGRAAAPVHSAATRAGAGARRPMPHRVRERLRCVLLLHGGSEAARQAQAGGSSAAADGKEDGHGSQGFSSTASCPWACQGAQSRLSHAAARLCCYNLSDFSRWLVLCLSFPVGWLELVQGRQQSTGQSHSWAWDRCHGRYERSSALTHRGGQRCTTVMSLNLPFSVFCRIRAHSGMVCRLLFWITGGLGFACLRTRIRAAARLPAAAVSA